MPTFIRDFGFDSVTAQILTVPVYAVGAISFVIQAYFSDKLAVRGPFILANMVLCLIGYIILAAVEGPTGVKYFALFIVSLGMWVALYLELAQLFKGRLSGIRL